MSTTNKREASPSAQVSAELHQPAETETTLESEHADSFQMPVETEIYILPDGRVIVADLPAGLAQLPSALGTAEETTATEPVGGS